MRFSSGEIEEAAYSELWEGAVAVYWMCIRSKQQDGVSTGHGRLTYQFITSDGLRIDLTGRSGRLQVHLGYPEVLSDGIDTQK